MAAQDALSPPPVEFPESEHDATSQRHEQQRMTRVVRDMLIPHDFARSPLPGRIESVRAKAICADDDASNTFLAAD